MDFSLLEKRLGVKFKDRSYLKQALTHRSYLNENRGWPLGHNERLEFLGDAVLELIVSTFLYETYRNQPEGKLTEYRAALVNIEVLAELAGDLGMSQYMLLSRGEAKDTGRARQVIIGNAFEAVIGALFVDQGYDAARHFVEVHLLSRTDELIAQGLMRNSKSRLQEAAQGHFRVTPTYEVLEENGPDHDKVFVVGVYFGSELIAKGRGGAKRLAEEKAAEQALITKGWILESTK
jgi:ribonuclease-3